LIFCFFCFYFTSDEPPVLPNQQPKKRRKKDIVKNPDENNNVPGSNKHVKVGKVASGKTTSIQAKNVCNSSQNLVVPGEHYEDLKPQNQLDIYGISSKKKTADTKPISVSSVSLKTSSDDFPAATSEAKDADKKIGAFQSKNTSGSFDATHQKYHEKGAHAQSKSQPVKPSKSIDGLENTSRSKEKNGRRQLPDLNLSVGKRTTKATVSFYFFGSFAPFFSFFFNLILRILEKKNTDKGGPLHCGYFIFLLVLNKRVLLHFVSYHKGPMMISGTAFQIIIFLCRTTLHCH